MIDLQAHLAFEEQSFEDPELYHSILEEISKRYRIACRRDKLLETILRDPDQSVRKFCDLVVELKSSGLRFEPHRKVQLRVGEKIRTLFLASWPERVLLMAAQKVLSRSLENRYSQNLYSFRKGQGPQVAHRALVNYLKQNREVFIGKRDVASYGESISQDILFSKLELIFPVEKFKVLRRLIELGTRIKYIDHDGTEKELNQGIPAGSPLVPVLENFYLTSLDQRIDSILGVRQDCFYARYGDDILFSSVSQSDFDILKNEVSEEIGALRLQVSVSKSTEIKLCKSSRYLEWLGVSFHSKGTVGPRPKHFRAVSNMLYKSIQALIREVHHQNLSLSQSIRAIENSLALLLDRRIHYDLVKVTQRQSHGDPIKRLDHNLRRYLVRRLSRQFLISKKESWKIVRGMKLPSLNFQRRAELRG